MTTINNLTIEQMREIVEGAPTWAIWWCVEKKKFLDFIPCSKCLIVEDLRTAIAKHDSPEFKVGDWIIDSLVGNKVIRYHEGYAYLDEHYVKAFLKHATPEEIKAGHRLDQAPKTCGCDLVSGKDWSAKIVLDRGAHD